MKDKLYVKSLRPSGRSRLVMMWTIGLLLLIAGRPFAAGSEPLTSETEGAGPDSADAGHRHGFYLGAGWGYYEIDPNLDARSAVTSRGIEPDESTRGAHLVFGWGMGSYFATELRTALSEIHTGTPLTNVYMALATFDFPTTVLQSDFLEVYVVHGFGGLALHVEDEEAEDFTALAVVGDFGGGFVTHLSRHFSFAAEYRYSILNFERESIGDFEEDNGYNIGGTGYMNSWITQLTYDF